MSVKAAEDPTEALQALWPRLKALAAPLGIPQDSFSLELEVDNGLLITADALTHGVISFEYPEWVNGFDLLSNVAISTRRELLAWVVTARTTAHLYHGIVLRRVIGAIPSLADAGRMRERSPTQLQTSRHVLFRSASQFSGGPLGASSPATSI